ncbi:hypothetical protein QJS04_geneDACA021018 [Acorus gramineus]|uniref:ALBINO3-like protein 2, chloroplastic n=1 Tax=Acorus gramineus TaxID=55184 RepID=A0AAV9B8A4_ACOGR|nr:hypothetical protein QJS04_geneDACA021018 [Acorus gramineus]
MARPRNLYSELRRLRSLASSRSPSSSPNPRTLPPPPNPHLHRALGFATRRWCPNHDARRPFQNGVPFRSFSSRSSWGGVSETVSTANETDGADVDGWRQFDLGFEGSEVVNEAVGEGLLYAPVRGVISLIDELHSLTGFPWWTVIMASTMVMRVSLMPLVIKQLKKQAEISKLLPKYIFSDKQGGKLSWDAWLIGKGLLTYKMYLNILTIPILYIGFHIPQGSLVYWMTNNALNLVQLLSVRHPSIREKLGLPKTVDPAEARITMGNLSKMQKKQDTQRVLLEHNNQTGDPSLDEHLGPSWWCRKVIEKDSAVVGALVAMGQILYSKKLVNEAAEYFESAISKADEDDSLLVVACYGAGVSRIAEGKKWEGIENLKRIAEMEVPVSPMDQHCYYKALVLLGCTLSEEGHNSEAVKHLRRAATYDPGVDRFVKECEALIKMDECKAEDKTTGSN